MTEQSKDKLRALIANNKLEEAIKALTKISAQLNSKKHKDKIITQSALYKQYLENLASGTETTETLQVSLARIRRALLQIIEELSDKENTLQNISPSWTTAKAVLAILLLVLTLGLGWYALNFFDLQADPTSSTAENFLQLSIHIHDQAGKSPIKGSTREKVLVDFYHLQQLKQLDENGNVHFDKLPASLKDSLFKITLVSEEWELVLPNKEYRMEDKDLNVGVRKKKLAQTETKVDKAKIETPKNRSERKKTSMEPATPKIADKGKKQEDEPKVPIVETIKVSCNIGRANTAIQFEDRFLPQQINVRSDEAGNISYTISRNLIGTDLKVGYSKPNEQMIPSHQWVEIILKPSGCIIIP